MPGVIAEQQSAPKARKPTKNEQRRAKKKQQKREASQTPTPAPETPTADESTAVAEDADANHPVQPVEPSDGDPIQTVPAIDSDLPDGDPLYAQFANVFARFNEEDKADPALKEPEKPEVFYDDDDMIQDEDEEAETQQRLSKKARKAANKLSIAELKAIVRKPETVEWTDTSAQDPKLLVNIKSSKNVVPVPTHWALKREYLSSKRGIEKPAFALPKFIAETGISDMRDAVLEKQAEATLKQRQRERVAPKMGRLDIDYQKLYEAFFRRQTKPALTGYGEVYYEGKEYETDLRHLKPGQISDELAEALNIPHGFPPPWLIAQQKVGLPPSYPALKIVGVNEPLPPGGQWGYQPGGWGKPPTDDAGKPAYGGDLFGMGGNPEQEKQKEEERARLAAVDRTLWGELAPIEDEPEEEEQEEEESDDEKDQDETGWQTQYSGTETPGGIYSTVPTEFGTQSMAEDFNLRKPRRGTETEESNYPRSAGRVLQQQNIQSQGFFGGSYAYDVGGRSSNAPVLGERDDRGRKRKAGDMDISMDPDALERDDRMSKEEVKRQYDAQRSYQGAGGWQGGAVDQEDLTAMIAEEAAKRQKRDAEKERRGRGRGR